MKYDRSSIMSAAWRIFRKGVQSFAVALRMAWANAKAHNAAKAAAGINEETDAREDQGPRRPEAFVELAQYAFHNDLDEETAQALVELWQIEYMNGYREGGAA